MTADITVELFDWERKALRDWYEATPVRVEPFEMPERSRRVTWPTRGLRLGTAVAIIGATAILAAVILGSVVLALRGDEEGAVPASPPDNEPAPTPTVFGAGSPGSSQTVELGHVIETVHVTEVTEMRRMTATPTGNVNPRTQEITECVKRPPGVEVCKAIDKATGTDMGRWTFVGGTRITEWSYAGPDLIYGNAVLIPDDVIEFGSKLAVTPDGVVITVGPDAHFAEIWDFNSNRWLTLRSTESAGPSSLEHYYIDGESYIRSLDSGAVSLPAGAFKWRLGPLLPLVNDFLDILDHDPDKIATYLTKRYGSVEPVGGASSGDKYPGHYRTTEITTDGWERAELWVDEETGFPERMVIEQGTPLDPESLRTTTLTFSRYNEPLDLPPVPDIAKGD